ncbi:hypothetical protein NCLIV_059530 [Neospora caninum Liverpool]|uniref:RNA pseudouridine synthase superfamily protein n=1 Tax=Neospora caninum (strain Liverpool) TaxID=572307 RepID=F0VP82_NEOCL|nr:hypothetical protein NCLIV_059530 [Neospora caninum Liverpool]CBZ55528.1 hypothetical protein NCLIV_059530 [Neospora caninum Liverpool]CEL70267.1 TPA: RNA pseudouridine synthase superfamily protein [Neospora caninum Liverpool]|eukprot:XP_003885556.1 hypothetical protein NCLIV_059530 [Neospora caninum Liverpool]
MRHTVCQKVEGALQDSRPATLVASCLAQGVCTPDPASAGRLGEIGARGVSTKARGSDAGCTPVRRLHANSAERSSRVPSSFFLSRLRPPRGAFFPSLASPRFTSRAPLAARPCPPPASPSAAGPRFSFQENEEPKGADAPQTSARRVEEASENPTDAGQRRLEQGSSDRSEPKTAEWLQAEKEVLEEIAASRRLCCKRVEASQAGLRVGIFALRHVVGSWPAVANLLRKKELFLVRKDAPFAQHVKFLRKQRDRPEASKDARVNAGDLVYFPRGSDALHHAKEISRPSAGLDLRERLLYKDTDFLAIDKPFGLCTGQLRPRGRRAPKKDTEKASVLSLAHQLRFSLDETPKLLHRLGDEVTGVLLLGRTKQTAALALDRFRGGTFGTVTFLALVHGRPPGGRREGVIRIPLAENEAGVMVPTAVQRGGAAVVTRWRLLKVASAAGRHGCDRESDAHGSAGLGFSLIELEIDQQQCRHQARAHCLYGLCCPIVGDRVYGPLASRWRQLASTGASVVGHAKSAVLKDLEETRRGRRGTGTASESAHAGKHGGEAPGAPTEDRAEEKRRNVETRQALGVTAPSMLHLHSRGIRFETFAGDSNASLNPSPFVQLKSRLFQFPSPPWPECVSRVGRPVHVEAPLPPHMRQAASRLGWGFFVAQTDAHLSALKAHTEDARSCAFEDKDERRNEDGTDARELCGDQRSLRRDRHGRKVKVAETRLDGTHRCDKPSVWDVLGGAETADEDDDEEEGEEAEGEEECEAAWEVSESNNFVHAGLSEDPGSQGRGRAARERPEKHWIARFFEERAKKGERQCKAAARRPAPLPPVVTKLHR